MCIIEQTITPPDILNDLSFKFDKLIIEGLKRKGFEFKHKLELEAFIKERCRCEDNVDLKKRTYYIDNIPFFLHDYNIEPIDHIKTNDGYTITANLGTYTYL